METKTPRSNLSIHLFILIILDKIGAKVKVPDAPEKGLFNPVQTVPMKEILLIFNFLHTHVNH